MILFFFIFGIIYFAFAITVISIALYSAWKGRERPDSDLAKIVLLFSEIVFTIIGPAIGFMRYDQYQPDIPFSKHHVLIIIVLVISSSASFWLSRLTARTNNLYLRILLSAGMLQGILLCAIVTIHFAGYLLLGMIYPWLGFELLSPLFAFFFLSRQLYFYNRHTLQAGEMLPYREQLVMQPLPVQLFRRPLIVRLFVYAFLAIAFIIIQVLLGYAIGLAPDAIIKAFTQSVGFTFSMPH